MPLQPPDLVATCDLRFVLRHIPHPVRILQQRWAGDMKTADGWRDVPLVDDVDTKLPEPSQTPGHVGTEIERLRSIIRRCMGGTTMIEIAPGEIIGLCQFKPEDADAGR